MEFPNFQQISKLVGEVCTSVCYTAYVQNVSTLITAPYFTVLLFMRHRAEMMTTLIYTAWQASKDGRIQAIQTHMERGSLSNLS